MDFWKVVQNRHSVRDFSDEPVSRESVERIIHAAGLAPSARNAQPWRFHVSTGSSRVRVGAVIAQATAHLDEYMTLLGPELYERAVRWYSDLGGAPVVIGVSMERPSDEWDLNNELLSMGAAIENLLLAATAEGLAACNITFLKWLRQGLEDVFDVAEGRSIIAVIALGHHGEAPDEVPPKKLDISDWLE